MANENLKAYNADPSKVKILGRTLCDNSVLWLILSASGVEFTISAKNLYFNLVGDVTAHPSAQEGKCEMNWARYEIFVDGKSIGCSSMDSAEKSVCVFSEDTKRTVTVRLLKLTEGTQSFMGIKNLLSDPDAKITPTAKKKLRIEFIGDSITCGYGVEGKSAQEPFSTQTENALKAYAYRTAENLGADCTLTSFSGFGIVSGWTDNGNLNPIQLVPEHYKKFAFSWNTKIFEDREWDFSSYRPNLIVINLGTNDDSYTQDIEERQAQYASEYVKFLKNVRKENPDAYFILSMGIMLGGNRLFSWIEKAAAEYTAQTGDSRLSLLHFVPQTEAEGFGCDFHPSEATQVRCSNVLTDFIKSLLAEGKINLSSLSADETKSLVKAAYDMLPFSYSPYSNFRVGAALETQDGKIYTGCNIENVAFGPSNCAERTAFFKAVSEGERKFKAIAIVGGPQGKTEDFCAPCGVCRQVMAEFCSPDFEIILAKNDGAEIKTYTLAELLPLSFNPQDEVGATAG